MSKVCTPEISEPGHSSWHSEHIQHTQSDCPASGSHVKERKPTKQVADWVSARSRGLGGSEQLIPALRSSRLSWRATASLPESEVGVSRGRAGVAAAAMSYWLHPKSSGAWVKGLMNTNSLHEQIHT